MTGSGGDCRAELESSGVLADVALPWALGAATRVGLHASRRRFYRLLPQAMAAGGPASAVLVLYDETDAAEIARYERTAAWLGDAGVRVPEISAVSARTLVVEDGGDALFADSAGPDCVGLYQQAAAIVVAVQAHGRRVAPPNPEWVLDAERLRNELEFAEQHALRGWLGAAPSGARGAGFDRLATAVAALPRAVCHRDFHSRNLMVVDGRLLVLDFQDLMPGPHLYDLVSLLRDDYRSVPQAGADAALEAYWDACAVDLAIAAAADVPSVPGVLPPAARQSFCLTAAQRAIKALGTFGYQVTVAGNRDYATFGPGTWAHARAALTELGWHDLVEELAAFDRL